MHDSADWLRFTVWKGKSGGAPGENRLHRLDHRKNCCHDSDCLLITLSLLSLTALRLAAKPSGYSRSTSLVTTSPIHSMWVLVKAIGDNWMCGKNCLYTEPEPEPEAKATAHCGSDFANSSSSRQGSSNSHIMLDWRIYHQNDGKIAR